MVWQHAKNSGERAGIQSRTGAGRKPLDCAHIPHNGDCEMLEARHHHCRPNHTLTGTWASDIAALLANLKGRRRLDGTLRPDDRRGKEVRRVEHSGPGRLERGARAQGSRDGRSAAQRGSGKELLVGGVKLPLALPFAKIDG